MQRENNVIPVDKLKDVLLTRTAIKTLKPEHWVDRVIAFQFKDASAATKYAKEVEISGFGKFYISASKVKKRLLKYENSLAKKERELARPDLPKEKRKQLESQKAVLIGLIDYLKSKQ